MRRNSERTLYARPVRSPAPPCRRFQHLVPLWLPTVATCRGMRVVDEWNCRKWKSTLVDTSRRSRDLTRRAEQNAKLGWWPQQLYYIIKYLWLDLDLTELISFGNSEQIWSEIFWALWLANLIWKFWSDLVGNSKDLPKSFLLSWHCEWMQLFRKIEKCLDESVAMLVSNKGFTVAMVLRWVRWNWRHASVW